MTDPNLTYKAAWRELREKLGRVPTTSDSEYWQLPGSPSAREGKKWTSVETAGETSHSVPMSDAGHIQTTGASPTGATAPTGASDSPYPERAQNPSTASAAGLQEPVSRKQAPQAGVYAREEGHEHDYGPTAVPGAWYCQCGALLLASTEQERALANPGTADPPPEAVTVPEANSEAVRASQSLSSYRVGARGPNGGMVAKCEGCGELWEREKRRGRPNYRCEECR